MNKEEIKAMIDATINENGERNITGKALNLALNAIVDATGEGNGGGGLMIQFIPRFTFGGYENMEPSDFVYHNEEVTPDEYAEALQSCIDNNIKVYNILMECNRNHTPVPGPIYFDTTFFEWYYNGRQESVRGGVATAWRIWWDDEHISLYTLTNQQTTGTAYLQEETLWSDGLLGEPESQPV